MSLGLEISDQIWLLNLANQKTTEEDIKAFDNEGSCPDLHIFMNECVAYEMYDILIWWLYIYIYIHHTYIYCFTSSLPYLFFASFCFWSFVAVSFGHIPIFLIIQICADKTKHVYKYANVGFYWDSIF